MPRSREWLWLAMAGLVAGAIIGLLLAFGAYENAHRAAASQAAAAELEASQLNALEWQTIAKARLEPGVGARVERLLGAIGDHLNRIRPEGAASRAVLIPYTAAIRREFQLVGAGRTDEARRVDAARVDPAYRALAADLEGVVRENTRSAGRTAMLALAGDIAAVGIGVVIVSILLLRFAVARRALAAAEVEERLLRETDKAKDNLISVVSHDLRTPLTSIVGYLEILREEQTGPLSPQQRRALAVMERNASRLASIVDDLLFLSRAEEGRMELSMAQLSLARAAAEAIEDQHIEAEEKGIRLHLAATPSPPVLADRHRVDLLIENLLSNALKFTPAGGSVELGVSPADGHVRLEVSDTGIGISAENQRHLFERFFRTEETVGMPGVGLGLSIVKAIADAHHATVSVHSVPGNGTTFRVDFPHAPSHAGRALRPPARRRGTGPR